MKTFAPILVLPILAACAGTPARQDEPSNPEARPDHAFRYDEATGTCVDSAGRAGFNTASAALFSAKDEATNTYPGGDGECVDFSGFDFNALLGSGYPTLASWNLQGARFSGAKFLFANMTGADVRGADLRELKIGYTRIDGSGDRHTQVGQGCEVGDGFAIRCSR